MRKPASTLLLILPLLFASCGSKHEAVMDEYIALMNEMVDILKTVKDEATAELATPKLEAVGSRIESLSAKMNNMNDLTPQELMELFKDYQEPMQEVLQELSEEMMRVAMITDMDEELQQVMEAMNFGST